MTGRGGPEARRATGGGDMECVLDGDQRCVSANGPFLDAFGLGEQELIGRHVTDPEGRSSFAALIEDARGGIPAGECLSTQRWWDFPALGFRYVRIVVERPRGPDGAVLGTTIRVRDATDARLAQEALEESEQRFEDFADVVGDWLWELDAELRFIYLSARFEAVMDLARDEVLGRRRIELFPGEDPAAVTTRNHHRDLALHRPFDGYTFSRICDDGTKRVIEMSGRPCFDANGRFLGYRGVARELTRFREMEDRMAHLQAHDALTGLVNRHALVQRLQRVVETAAADGSAHGLCYVDVDQFRVINDRWGHGAGDQLLADLADLLRECTRRRDTVARIGGNAFAILMEHCSLGRIEEVAEAVRAAVGAYRLVRRDAIVEITVTVGVVPIDAASRTTDRVLRAADRACYAAKSAGGDRILVHGRPDRRAARERRRGEPAPTAH